MTRAVRRNVWDVPQFNLDGVQAVVDESGKFGRKVAAHARGDKGIAPAVDGGVNSPEHATGIGEATLEKMQPRGMQKAKYAAQPRNTGMHRAIASSVTIAYGTDAGAAEPTERAIAACRHPESWPTSWSFRAIRSSRSA